MLHYLLKSYCMAYAKLLVIPSVLQDCVRAQIAEKERQKEEARQRKALEERQEEERIAKQREKLQREYQEEQERIRRKEVIAFTYMYTVYML